MALHLRLLDGPDRFVDMASDDVDGVGENERHLGGVKGPRAVLLRPSMTVHVVRVEPVPLQVRESQHAGVVQVPVVAGNLAGDVLTSV